MAATFSPSTSGTRHDVVLARQKARAVANALKFDIAGPDSHCHSRFRNCPQYLPVWRRRAGRIPPERLPGKNARDHLRDKGKGIPHLNEILDGKYVSKTGMGLGIIGAKRLMDQFHIESTSGQGNDRGAG